MSTKTTFKRVALVAVAALGLGVVSSVAPANAVAEQTVTSISAGTLIARPTVETTATLTFNYIQPVASTDTFTVGVKLTSYPALSAAAKFELATKQTKTLTNTGGDSGVLYGTVAAGSAVTNTTGTHTAVITGGSSLTTAVATLKFTPDIAGTYQFLIWTGGSSYTAGYTSTLINVTTSGAPTTATLSTVASTFAKSAATSTGASYVKIVLKDADGKVTAPTANESIDLSVGGAAAATTVGIGGIAQSTGSKKSYNSGFGGGSLYVSVDNTAAETFAITLSGSGLLSGNGLSATQTFTSKTAVASTVISSSAVVVPDALVATAANTGGFTAATGTSTSTNLGVQPLTVAVASPTAATYAGFFVTDVTGKITGNSGQTYQPLSGALAAADTTASISITAALGSSTSDGYTIKSLDGTTQSSGAALTVTGGKAAFNAVGSISPSIVLSAIGAKNTFTAKLTDQFGGAIANTAVTASISGRNSAISTGNLVSDANGYVTWSYTDAGTATSVLTQDIVTFTSGSSSKTATVNFGTTTVATVVVTGGATADVAPAKTWTPISSGNIGYTTSGAVAFTATVKDAAGNPLAGVPVTFTVDKGLLVKTETVDYATVYTGAAGTAVTYAFNWITEKQTVTATAGGKTGTGYANWRSETASQARTISAVADSTNGNVITFTVKDRFGNGVKGANVTLSRVGTGFFFGGASTSTATTGSDGTVAVQFTGSGDVTGTLDTTTEGYDVAGSVQATALKAAVAGTTLGTGLAFSTAGVATATVNVAAGSDAATTAAQAASDAAAEATDAANAATDAANAAAEAADAATAAAQDAADAVAALSTQVSEMIDALKKQITALTNLVIKIQKKVKA